MQLRTDVHSISVQRKNRCVDLVGHRQVRDVSNESVCFYTRTHTKHKHVEKTDTELRDYYVRDVASGKDVPTAWRVWFEKKKIFLRGGGGWRAEGRVPSFPVTNRSVSSGTRTMILPSRPRTTARGTFTRSRARSHRGSFDTTPGKCPSCDTRPPGRRPPGPGRRTAACRTHILSLAPTPSRTRPAAEA